MRRIVVDGLGGCGGVGVVDWGGCHGLFGVDVFRVVGGHFWGQRMGFILRILYVLRLVNCGVVEAA